MLSIKAHELTVHLALVSIVTQKDDCHFDLPFGHHWKHSPDTLCTSLAIDQDSTVDELFHSYISLSNGTVHREKRQRTSVSSSVPPYLDG